MVMCSEDLVQLARSTVAGYLLPRIIPLLFILALIAFIIYKLRHALQAVTYQLYVALLHPMYTCLTVIVYALHSFRFLLSLSAILSWTQKAEGFPRALIDALIHPVYALLGVASTPSYTYHASPKPIQTIIDFMTGRSTGTRRS